MLENAIFENAGCFIITTDQNGQIFSINPSAERLFGYKSHELAGQVGIWSLFDDELLSKNDIYSLVETFKDKSFDGLTNWEYPEGAVPSECSLIRKDGSSVFVRLNVTPLLKDGKLDGLLFMGSDLSLQKKNYQEIQLLQSITLAIVEADCLNSALRVTLEKICQLTGWVLGQAWVPSNKKTILKCSPAWYSTDESLQNFRDISVQTEFQPDEGVPGAVWSNKKPIWMDDSSIHSNFLRSKASHNAGLKAGVVIPVLYEDEVFAVLEFFIKQPRAKDNHFLGIVLGVASQLGLVFRRKQLENELKKALRNDFRNIVKNLQNLVFRLYRRNDGAIIYTLFEGKAAEKIGLSTNVVYRKTPHEIFSKGLADYLYEHYQRAFAGESVTYEANYSGNIYYVTLSPIIISGEVKEVIGSAVDISERVFVEQRLKFYERVFQNTIDAMLVTDMYGNIFSFNQSFCALTGYSNDELLGRNFQSLFLKDKSQSSYSQLLPNINAERNLQGEFWCTKKSGDEFLAKINISSLADDRGGNIKLVLAINDITERKISELHIHHQAYHDFLTGLPNRALFNERLLEGMAISKTNNKKLGLLMIDLDNFKYVNDTFGHAVGDHLLQVVAERLRSAVRGADTVSRLGGDEFTVIISEIENIAVITEIAQRILVEFSKPLTIGEHPYQITSSIGIAIYPSDSEEPEQLMKFSDMAMYHAKNNGKNRFVFFSNLTVK